MGLDAYKCTHYNNSLSIETKEESRYLPSETYKLLIIGSYGEMFESIQVAPKIIPSGQEGSIEWMTKDVNLIREVHERSCYCDRSVSVYLELPGKKQYSKDYYLQKIQEFLNNCKHNKGKNKHVYNDDTY